MYLKTRPGIFKTISVVLLTIVVGLWTYAYKSSIMKKIMNDSVFYEECKRSTDCPDEIKPMETTAVWLTCISLAVMVINLLVCLSVDPKGKLYRWDFGITNFVAVFIFSILILYCAIRFDQHSLFYAIQNVRIDAKFWEKIIAGGLALVTSIQLFATAREIRNYQTSPVTQNVFVQPSQQPQPYNVQMQYPAQYQTYPGQPQRFQSQMQKYPNHHHQQNIGQYPGHIQQQPAGFYDNSGQFQNRQSQKYY